MSYFLSSSRLAVFFFHSSSPETTTAAKLWCRKISGQHETADSRGNDGRDTGHITVSFDFGPSLTYLTAAPDAETDVYIIIA